MRNRNTSALLRDYDAGFWLWYTRYGVIKAPISPLPGGRWEYVKDCADERFQNRVKRRTEALLAIERRRIKYRLWITLGAVCGVPLLVAAGAWCWKLAVSVIFG